MVANSSSGSERVGIPLPIDNQSAGMRFDSAANLWPLRSVDPDATVFYWKRIVADGSWINFGTRGGRGFHFVPLASGDELGKARSDHGGRIGLAITLDRRAKQL